MIIIEKVIDVMPVGLKVGWIIKWVWLRVNVCIIGNMVGNTFGCNDFITELGSYKQGKAIETFRPGDVDTIYRVNKVGSYDDTSNFTVKKSPIIIVLIPSSENLISNLSNSIDV